MNYIRAAGIKCVTHIIGVIWLTIKGGLEILPVLGENYNIKLGKFGRREIIGRVKPPYLRLWNIIME